MFVEEVAGRVAKVGATLLGVSDLLLEQAPSLDVASAVTSIEQLSASSAPASPTVQTSPDDIAYLRKAWATIRERAQSRPAGTLLHQQLMIAPTVVGVARRPRCRRSSPTGRT